jgi:hypothetical protein
MLGIRWAMTLSVLQIVRYGKACRSLPQMDFEFGRFFRLTVATSFSGR